MSFELPELPYAKNALAPIISQETIEYHYGKHHRAYVTNLNNLTEGSELQKQSLEQIIKTKDGAIFNNAAQIYNHSFYWSSMSPSASGKPTGQIAELLTNTYGSFDAFKEQFSKAAKTLFGSGWAWLVKDDSKIWIETTSNAGCPLTDGKKPLLTCDVWEHAYYIDYRNARPKYIDSWWELVNWDFVNQNL